VPNGVVDLEHGALRPGKREDRITLCTAVPFDPSATCARWERFLREIFGGDEPLAAFVHRAIGYSLTGDTGEQCCFMGYGHGSNGKGTLVNTLKYILGDYSWNMPFSTLEMRDRAGIPNDVAALDGRRFVVASETNDGARLNEARVKALTGCDPVTARFLHGEFFTFEPVAKFWLSVNHKPVIKDDSHGFWRRLRLIPFLQRFDVNPNLADELRAEGRGILAWAVVAAWPGNRTGCSLRPSFETPRSNTSVILTR
jgi:putative DNA primase/helicase